jgi:hypothetical protein
MLHATVALPDPQYATVLPVHIQQHETYTHTCILYGMNLQFHKTDLLRLSSQNNAQAKQGVRERKKTDRKIQ